MSESGPPKPQIEEKDGDSFSRFEKFARALFRVDKRDVPKHEPKKRKQASRSLAND